MGAIFSKLKECMGSSVPEMPHEVDITCQSDCCHREEHHDELADDKL